MKNHSYLFILLIFILFLNSFTTKCQQTDENTYIINQYFKFNNESVSKEVKTFLWSNVNVVRLNQIGNNNEIDIKEKGGDSHEIVQKGNNNEFNYLSYYNTTPLNLNILQQGNFNSLQIYGENSLVKNMSIIQKSNFKTLIIKNY